MSLLGESNSSESCAASVNNRPTISPCSWKICAISSLAAVQSSCRGQADVLIWPRMSCKLLCFDKSLSMLRLFGKHLLHLLHTGNVGVCRDVLAAESAPLDASNSSGVYSYLDKLSALFRRPVSLSLSLSQKKKNTYIATLWGGGVSSKAQSHAII